MPLLIIQPPRAQPFVSLSMMSGVYNFLAVFSVTLVFGWRFLFKLSLPDMREYIEAGCMTAFSDVLAHIFRRRHIGVTKCLDQRVESTGHTMVGDIRSSYFNQWLHPCRLCYSATGSAICGLRCAGYLGSLVISDSSGYCGLRSGRQPIIKSIRCGAKSRGHTPDLSCFEHR